MIREEGCEGQPRQPGLALWVATPHWQRRREGAAFGFVSLKKENREKQRQYFLSLHGKDFNVFLVGLFIQIKC
jgi:hypothetical protein